MGEVILRRMRAAVITRPRRCEVQIVDTPVPAADQVLIEVEGCGVSRAHLAHWETAPAEPGAPGDEGWGRIVGVGSEVHDRRVDERVAFLSERAFAEYDVATAASVVPLPASLAGQPVPGRPLGRAVSVFRRSGIQPGQHVAIVGVGFIGALLTQLATHVGATVIALSRRPYSLRLATQVGASEAISLDQSSDAIVARVDAITSGQRCARVIDVAGVPHLSTRLCAPRGRIVDEAPDDPRAIAAAIDGMMTGWIDPSLLYTHVIPLADIGEAFELLRTRPVGFVKAVVTP